MLAGNCVYVIREKRIETPSKVIASYKGNGDEANQRFDAISYGSSVRVGQKSWVVIEFWDEITHRGRTHRHECEQWVRVEGGTIVKIEHRDLEGEVESLKTFKAWCAEA